MYQDFRATTQPEQGPPRLAALRSHLRALGLDGVIIPRSDMYQGEYVAPCDERLAWLTGFTGSAGFCVVLPEVAGVFVDGRYRVQGRLQCADVFSILPYPETKRPDWLRQQMPQGGVIGFDPWLHTPEDVSQLEKGLAGSQITLKRIANPIDALWHDRPSPPASSAVAQPVALTGRDSDDKLQDIAKAISDAGQSCAVLTQPDSLCWLLNMRGADLPRLPIIQVFAILHDDGRLDLFADLHRFEALALPASVHLRPPEAFAPALATLNGLVRLDKTTVPMAIVDILTEHACQISYMQDPCVIPKARKTEAELAGARAAHLRDGAAMVEFLCWLDGQARAIVADRDHVVTEIDIVRKLEHCRVATGALQDLSFDTIAGSGPNGAIVHYRVTEATNRRLRLGDLMLVDSGGQYQDGTTDITRTIAIGPASTFAAACFTRVLSGMIAMSRAQFPRGVAGAHLDALARYPLWLAGQDYDHGTGHGVGSYLSVHEGPQRLSRLSTVPLSEGMILSNEPGFYVEGQFGIRIENLITVCKPDLPQGSEIRDWLGFETLTLAPIDRSLISPSELDAGARDWLNRYHARVRDLIGPLVSKQTRDWLWSACEPI